MRLFDANSSYWAIRHIYIFVAIAGVVVLVGGYFITDYMIQRNREIRSMLSPDDPMFEHYRQGTDALLVFFLSMYVGGGLLVLSPVVAIGYHLIRCGVTFKLKGSNVA